MNTETQLTAHTPGPWILELGRWHEKAPLSGFAIRAKGKIAFVASANMSPPENHSTVIEDEHIARGITTGFSAAECEANARLIAAAPDMVEEMKEGAANLRLIAQRLTGADKSAIENQAACMEAIYHKATGTTP